MEWMKKREVQWMEEWKITRCETFEIDECHDGRNLYSHLINMYLSFSVYIKLYCIEY